MMRLLLVAPIALLLVIASSGSFCLTYSVVDIPLPQYAWEVSARDINKLGQATGYFSCYHNTDYSQAFIYENGIATPLVGLGGANSAGMCINDQGLVVGSSDTGQSYYSDYYEDWFAICHACSWLSGAVTDLGTLGGYRSGAIGVNNLGDAVGWSETTAVDSHGRQISKPFIRMNAVMTDLNQHLPSNSGWVLTSAYSINDSRQITGKGKLNGVDYGYFFDLSLQTIRPITYPAASWVEPTYGLNNSGAVAGRMLIGSQLHGIVWNPTAASTDIPPFAGYDNCYANDTNNAGQTVGYAEDIDPERYSAFLFQSGTLTSIYSLVNSPSVRNISYAWHISNDGWIVADATLQYESRQVILVPVRDTAPTAKASADDKPVSFRGIPVTAVFGEFFYIEATNRCSGIRVHCPGHTLTPGMAADVDGVIKTNEDHERYVEASRAVQNGQASVNPIGMPLKVLGGGAWNTGTGGCGQSGVTGGTGLNNIGLLVRTWGTLGRDIDGTYYLDDGCGSRLLLDTPAGFNKTVGQPVLLNGISSCRRDTYGNICPLLRVPAN